jgi:hypothetical protein
MAIQLSKKSLGLLLAMAAGIGTLCSWPLVRADQSSLAKSEAKPPAPVVVPNDKIEEKKPTVDEEQLPKETFEERMERLIDMLRNEKDEETRLQINEEIQREKVNHLLQLQKEAKEKRDRE